ncbi:hypothetical protein GCM10010116_07080 [Microbispora rosea subsp. aerata]|nr:hypothetical protein [Microbispora rosea]GGO03580.1 hypothetical protein GCM10010116_07080 [Microbispora rosea subsp. aerata]GIH54841.1 hypothetical protein Mro02_17550 [Microbispora rosea subsp. aerata]GLJ83685.1 hypothetical protein GCM10017588_24130 [Microbispora rosea subsp. aerata]
MIFTTEAVLAYGYAAGLLVTAAGLDRMARHVGRRPERHRIRPDHDTRVCPAGRTPRPADREPHLARPSACVACPGGPGCARPGGGEIVRAPRPWPHSEAGRFHRGLALVLVVLAASLTLIEAVRRPAWPDLALAAAMLTAIAVMARWLVRRLRATPAGFPEPGGKATDRDRYASVRKSRP